MSFWAWKADVSRTSLQACSRIRVDSTAISPHVSICSFPWVFSLSFRFPVCSSLWSRSRRLTPLASISRHSLLAGSSWSAWCSSCIRRLVGSASPSRQISSCCCAFWPFLLWLLWLLHNICLCCLCFLCCSCCVFLLCMMILQQFNLLTVMSVFSKTDHSNEFVSIFQFKFQNQMKISTCSFGVFWDDLDFLNESKKSQKPHKNGKRGKQNIF